MAMQTYFIVQPFMETRRGALVALPPVAARDADHARRLMKSQSGVVGAIALSRAADPEAGDYEEAIVLGRWGKVPEGEMEEAA